MKVFWLVLSIFIIHLDAQSIKIDRDKEVQDYYQNWKQNYLIKEKNSLYRIATDKKDKQKTVSEGQGYGMLITALMTKNDKDSQKVFDGLWRFSRDHQSSLSKNLMSWEVPEKKGANSSAFDGDADIAYALILAHYFWGSKGEIDYKKEANRVLDAIWKYTIGDKSHLPLLGDWVHNSSEKYNQYTVRTSDFMTGHFKAFYRFSGDKKWLKVVKATQKALLDVQDKKTGLIPDFIRYDHKKGEFVAEKEGFLEHHDGAYYYNGCRIPFRLGVDVLINKDEVSKKIVQKLSRWIEKTSQNDPLKIKSGFELDGKVIGDYFSIVFTAPFGVSALATSQKDFATKIYDVVKNRHENYYEDSVALLSLLAMTGNFIDPTK